MGTCREVQAACAEETVQRWPGRGCGMLHASVHFWLNCLSSSWEWSPCALHHQNHLLELCLESPGPLEAAGRKRQSEIPPWKEVKKKRNKKLTHSNPNKAFAALNHVKHRLDRAHPSGAHRWCWVPWGRPAACRAHRKRGGTNKWQRRQLLMRFGCEPVPDAAVSITAVPGCVSTELATRTFSPTCAPKHMETQRGKRPRASAPCIWGAARVQRVCGCSELAPSPVGWAGDEPTAFNSGFMAAGDPKLTLCLCNVWMQLWGLINGRSRDLSCH